MPPVPHWPVAEVASSHEAASPLGANQRAAMATANPCYWRGLAVASGRAHMHYGTSVRPRRSLVGSPRFESRTPFHGWVTSSEGRRAVANGGVLPPGNGEWKLVPWSHWILPPLQTDHCLPHLRRSTLLSYTKAISSIGSICHCICCKVGCITYRP